MLRTVLSATAFFLTALAVPAQDFNPIEGLYSGHGEGELSVDLTHVEDDRYAISINTVVPISDAGGGCAGGVDGEVVLGEAGGTLLVENEDYDPAAGDSGLNRRYCEIGLAFDADGTLTLEERSGCLPYHGAACGFSGTVIHDAAGL